MTSSKEQRAKERRENPDKWPVRVFKLGEEPTDDDATSKDDEPVRDSPEALLKAKFESILRSIGEDIFGNAREKLCDGLRAGGFVS